MLIGLFSKVAYCIVLYLLIETRQHTPTFPNQCNCESIYGVSKSLNFTLLLVLLPTCFCEHRTFVALTQYCLKLIVKVVTG